LTPTPVKAAAEAAGIAVLAPERLRDFAPVLQALEPDLFIVVSYGKIVPADVLAVPKTGLALNVHPSLLPLYRGATPLQSVLRDGRAQTGVTIIAMDAGMDTGDIVAQEPTAVGPSETYGELHERLALAGARLLGEAIDRLERGALERRPQAGLAPEAEIAATLTRPLRKDDFVLDWSMPARALADRVRAFAPAPGARATVAGSPLKILAAHAVDGAGDARAGEIAGIAGDALLVATGDGRLALERVVPPNRGALNGADFARSLQHAK
jgi:methionyl-tRNA formyltransferase